MNAKLTRRDFLTAGLGTVGAAALAACAPKPAVQPTATSAPVQPTAAPPTAAPAGTKAMDSNWGLEDLKRLSEKKVELSGWAPALYNPVADVKSFNDQLFFKKMEELTNVRVNWQHASPDPNIDALALLMASGDLPDFICGISVENCVFYGMKGALEPLNDWLKCCTPYLTKVANQFPELLPSLTAPDGKIYAFPRVFVDEMSRVFGGFMIRKDWLDEVGMPLPETTEALYQTLKAFKAKDPKRYPFTFHVSPLIWQWGVGSAGPYRAMDLYREGPKIKYGPIQPQYREALVYINKLFKEELLDPEYQQTIAQVDVLKVRMTTGVSGFMHGWVSSHMEAYNKVLQASDPKARLVAMFPPKGPYGHQYMLSNPGRTDDSQGGAIAIKSKNKELLARYIDQYYSSSGLQLMGWGVQGDTFTVVNGQKRFTDKVLKNPNLSPGEYIYNYVSPQWIGPMAWDATSQEAMVSATAWEAKKVYAQFKEDINLPTLFFKPEEQDIIKAKMGDINTLVAETIAGLITGKKSLDKDYNDFVAKVQSMGINDVIAVYQTAYDRFLQAMKK